MRIAVIANVDLDRELGGVEVYLQHMIRDFRGRGHQVEHFGIGPGARSFVGRSGGIAAGFVGRLLNNRTSGQVVSDVAGFKPDVVWQHDLLSNWRAVKHLSEQYPTVLTNHTGELLKLATLPGGGRLCRRAVSHFRLVLAPSIELAEVVGRPAAYIPNGVDVERFLCEVPLAERRSMRESLTSSSRPMLLCARRWAPTKGVLHFAKALLEIPLRPDELPIVIFAGDNKSDYPSYAADIEESLARYEGPIVRLGAVPHGTLSKYYAAATLVVFPSIVEAVSLGFLEAAASGSPTVCTRVGGFREIVRDGVNGFLAEPADAQSLAAAIVKVLRSSAQDLQRISVSAQSEVLANYQWPMIFDSTEQCIVAALEHKEAESRTPYPRWVGV